MLVIVSHEAETGEDKHNKANRGLKDSFKSFPDVSMLSYAYADAPLQKRLRKLVSRCNYLYIMRSCKLINVRKNRNLKVKVVSKTMNLEGQKGSFLIPLTPETAHLGSFKARCFVMFLSRAVCYRYLPLPSGLNFFLAFAVDTLVAARFAIMSGKYSQYGK